MRRESWDMRYEQCGPLFREVAPPAILCHKGAYNRTFPFMEDNYPYTLKNQRGASKKPLVGGFGTHQAGSL